MKKRGKSKALRVQLPPEQDPDDANTTEEQTNADKPLLYKKRLDPTKIRQTRSMPTSGLRFALSPPPSPPPPPPPPPAVGLLSKTLVGMLDANAVGLKTITEKDLIQGAARLKTVKRNFNPGWLRAVLLLSPW